MTFYDDGPDNFSSAFESIDRRVPKKLKPFIRRDERPPEDLYFTSWTRYSAAYGESVKAMGYILKNAPEQLALRIPFLYLARHAIELSIKDAISYYAGTLVIDFKLDGHELLQLWDQFLGLMEFSGYSTDDDWSAHCGRLIAHIHQWDPKGERFRYPETRSGKEFDPTTIDVDGVTAAHFEISRYCDAAMSMLEAELQS